MPHKPTVLDLDALPNIVRLIVDIVQAVGKKSDGGAKITAAEWLQIGKDAGFVVKDLVPLITHK